jgi:phage host-nuclease inhibitor protein Gam
VSIYSIYLYQCANDYASQVRDIATEIRNLLKTMTLSCAPLANTKVTITKDGKPFTAAFTQQGMNLKFKNELEPGNYHVDYICLK